MEAPPSKRPHKGRISAWTAENVIGMEEPEMAIVLGVKAFLTRLGDVISNRVTTIQVQSDKKLKIVSERVTEPIASNENKKSGAHIPDKTGGVLYPAEAVCRLVIDSHELYPMNA